MNTILSAFIFLFYTSCLPTSHEEITKHPLIEAVYKGDSAAITKLADEGVNLETTEGTHHAFPHRKMTAIAFAAALCKATVIDTIFSRYKNDEGKKVHAGENVRRAVGIFEVSYEGSEKALTKSDCLTSTQKLLDVMSPKPLPDDILFSALEFPKDQAGISKLDLIKLLINKGASVKKTNQHGLTLETRAKELKKVYERYQGSKKEASEIDDVLTFLGSL